MEGVRVAKASPTIFKDLDYNQVYNISVFEEKVKYLKLRDVLHIVANSLFHLLFPTLLDSKLTA